MEKVLYEKFGLVGKRTTLQIDKEIQHLKEIDRLTSDKVRATSSLSKKKEKFQWNDEYVKDFCRIYTIGSYTDDYKDCKTIEEKINKFKKLKK